MKIFNAAALPDYQLELTYTDESGPTPAATTSGVRPSHGRFSSCIPVSDYFFKISLVSHATNLHKRLQ